MGTERADVLNASPSVTTDAAASAVTGAEEISGELSNLHAGVECNQVRDEAIGVRRRYTRDRKPLAIA